MPLFSPSLHGIAGIQTITNGDGANDRIVFYDASDGRAVRTQLARHAQEECFIFSTSGLGLDHATVANFTPNTTVPKIDIRWPFNWFCTGIRSTVSGRPAAGAAAGINILREGDSVFNNTTTINTSNATVATGAGNLYSSIVSPHASHTQWSRGNRIRMYLTAGASGSGNAANNFHALKIMLYGYRR